MKNNIANYTGYRKWKGWQGTFKADPKDGEYNTKEVGKFVPKLGSILELGFGDGEFMAWARQEGFEITGAELLPEMIEGARQAGYRAFKLEDIDPAERFDAIVSFSVLEHLSEDQLVDAMRLFAKLLKPRGVIISRFPNGGSPFGRIYQHGDITHLTTLTATKIQQLLLINDIPLYVDRVRNPAWPIGWRRGPMHIVLNLVRLSGRYVLYKILSVLVSIPDQLDANLTVHLRLTADREIPAPPSSS